MNLSIRDIILACEGEAHVSEKNENNKVSGVALDSRLVSEGGVFLAQRGEKVDGHSFIGQVFKKGAALVITEMAPEQVQNAFGTGLQDWGDYILVDDSLTALKKIAKAYREKLDIPFVGITGSVGKTSTKEFIAGVLSEKYNVLKTEGNYNNEIGVPLTLLRIREEHEAAVIEMGISDFGEMTRLTEMVMPDIAVITNIGQCHLENLKTRDGILKAKTEIFKGLRPGGRAVLFGEDDKLITVGPVGDSEPVFFGSSKCGIKESSTGENAGKACGKKLAVSINSSEDKGLFGSDAELELDYHGPLVCNKTGENEEKKSGAAGVSNETGKGAGFAEFNSEKLNVHVPLPGYHMVVNAAAAATVSILMGLTAEQIKAGIENMKPITGRNNIEKLRDITLIDDCYNANPVSMKSSIDLLLLAKGEKVAILGDMFELGENEKQLHGDVGEYAAEKGIDRIYCIGTLSENMFEAARKNSDKAGIMYWKTRDEFIAALKSDMGSDKSSVTGSGKNTLLPPGCTVLVKASHGMHFEEIVRVIRES